MSKVHRHPNSSDAALRELLNEALEERDRLDRRIDQLQALLEDPSVSARPAPRDTPPPVEARAEPPPAPVHPFQQPLGAPLPPGAGVPVTPPDAGNISVPSVDIGALQQMSEEQLDGLPFGVVTLDANGRVVQYNDTESRLAGLPPERVIGRNFFAEVAPCTRVKTFEGRFRAFASGRSRVALESFEFVFNFSHGAQRVLIMFSPARRRGQFHVSMIRV